MLNNRYDYNNGLGTLGYYRVPLFNGKLVSNIHKVFLDNFNKSRRNYQKQINKSIRYKNGNKKVYIKR